MMYVIFSRINWVSYQRENDKEDMKGDGRVAIIKLLDLQSIVYTRSLST